MEKCVIVDNYSESVVKIIDTFANLSAKNSIVKKVDLFAKLLKINKDTQSYVLNTTCQQKNLDDLAEVISRFEGISEIANFHIDRMSTNILESTGKMSVPCVKKLITKEITAIMNGEKYVSKRFSDAIKSCKRDLPPRKRAIQEK